MHSPKSLELPPTICALNGLASAVILCVAVCFHSPGKAKEYLAKSMVYRISTDATQKNSSQMTALENETLQLSKLI
jgi:hypothetical protein